MSEPRTFIVPEIPVVVICDGATCQMFAEDFIASEDHGLSPIKRAVMVARLRALADELDASP